MNTLQKTPKTPAIPQIRNDCEFVRDIVIAALKSVDDARQQCLMAGYYLSEKKASLPHGTFMDWVKSNIPEISQETANVWMRAASNVSRALSFGAAIEIDATSIPISRLLSCPVEELSAAAQELRQSWFDFTEQKTIRECLSGVFVDGDPAHRSDCAINGKTKGGTRGEDRKDWPEYTARHISAVTELLGCNEANREKRWAGMTAGQREAIKDSISTALCKWPTPLLEHITAQGRAQLKLR